MRHDRPQSEMEAGLGGRIIFSVSISEEEMLDTDRILALKWFKIVTNNSF